MRKSDHLQQVAIAVLPSSPGVYPPWVEHGLAGLTPAQVAVRLEAYLAAALEMAAA